MAICKSFTDETAGCTAVNQDVAISVAELASQKESQAGLGYCTAADYRFWPLSIFK